MSKKWKLLKDAPLDTAGIIWCRELLDRTDIVGTVHEYSTGERFATSSQARGYSFTHWHPLPEIPKPPKE